MTVLGTRPEIIRLSRVIEKLDAACDHTLVHTGQNYDPNLNEIFFDGLGVRQPDHYLDSKGAFGNQVGIILEKTAQIIQEEKPDKFLVLGDTNSALSAITAKRLGIPVYHMEAGNRCFDDRVPEEVNRRIIDHTSDILMPYTERSRQNLLAEGIPSRRIYVTGNPILEVLEYHAQQITESTILNQLGISAQKYFLVTLHRAENVDLPERLGQFIRAFQEIHQTYELPIVISTHPHTRQRISDFSLSTYNPEIRFFEPFSLFDFITLEKQAHCVLSDSGTVQEECAIFQVPNVTLRDVTERPETLECGSNILSGADPESILRCVEVVLSHLPSWNPPPEYLVHNVSMTVLKILTGYQHY